MEGPRKEGVVRRHNRAVLDISDEFARFLLALPDACDLVSDLRSFVKYFVQQSEKTFYLPYISERHVAVEVIRLYNSLSPDIRTNSINIS